MAEVLTPKTLNGVDVDALVNTVGAIAEDPALGSFQFRSSTQWKKGAQVETTFTGHKQNGVDSTRDVPHKWGGDEPVGLLGTGLHQGSTRSSSYSRDSRVKRFLEVYNREPIYRPTNSESQQ
jgi:hypothetical protein